MKTNSEKDILKYLFLIGIFIGPLFFWPWSAISFEIPKVFFMNRWIEIFAFASVTYLIFIRIQKEKVDSMLISLVLIFFLQVITSSLLGVDFNKSLSGNYYRADGLITLAHLVILFLSVVLFYRENWLVSTFKILAYSSILLSLWTIINAVFAFIIHKPLMPAWDKAVGINFGNPNFLAGYLIVSLPFTLYFYNKEPKIKHKQLILISLAVQFTAILLTRSWAGIFGILIFLLMNVVMKTSKNLLLTLTIILAFMGCLGLFILNHKSIQTPGITIAEGRERIIKKAILAFQKRLLFGWGWANFDYAFESVDWPVKYEDDIYVDKAHSHFLEILITTGIPGLVLYILIVLKTGFNLIIKSDGILKYLFISLVLFVLHSQTNIISISEEILFWLIVGVSAKDISKTSNAVL
ncbi:hypothetical protein A2962_02445 [Candidatus Woesebacteria bacterium RIFCSPLOWO2_01_FULL_39_61]|uniref:O-antigen ligase-related domain-containing protein n=1 Tax=Candidatus Woesebacteria bacterium RIFCSPHIGHO2_02_FULL_39_13 TaxID=1802505 RepID=A0A1F7Z4J4_9BACT|nr:MAG: hypothetical protein A2692_01460 [Candidatus Woesebacteria bacterium RIFCSPHIGHO2_01_FULL_39_95]OGM34019.1 MAG: hypothetical protein A3D01_03750 [Candidatus Woesebacteria bacterium RIFCSPHIGHO2_02_FULL_39_13]OGM38277.1 MAG: hypothetical protein A3E13_05860 [Candidatus Woesebacteria bacterium RIFCSPHIGHO2_12_FULL_40_20]OGM66983.1 MAG: hypothetical protein A2962_02445 [Candidatus Woesebacteria bacterium RIFCSPLOWO2_01_FULL_39_61]